MRELAVLLCLTFAVLLLGTGCTAVPISQKSNLISSSGLTGGNLPPCPGTWGNSSWSDCYGTFTFTDGAKYVGEYKDNQPSGQGTYTYADGSVYVGEWRDNKYNGQGTYTMADGRKYVGAYKNGLPNGQGTSTNPNGTHMSVNGGMTNPTVREPSSLPQLEDTNMSVNLGTATSTDRAPSPLPTAANMSVNGGMTNPTVRNLYVLRY